ncbi:DUF1338 domain-containing protein [Litorivicinus sp.]|nr:DUF1338 domain-containing protein [Litorivicinus sp.]
MDRNDFFNALWARYCTVAAQPKAINAQFKAHGESVINDHVALRSLAGTTFDLNGIGTLLEKIGYRQLDSYVFPDKYLDARSYYCVDNPNAPKIFVSTLRRGVLSDLAETILNELANALNNAPYQLSTLTQGVCWTPLSYSVFQELAAESEYAAWLSAWGLQANHFTVSVNHLKHFNSLTEVNEWIKSVGFQLNQSGGEIKGSKEVLLAQSATLADRVDYLFGCGQTRVIPSCFYEFAERFSNADGQLFQGFVTANADHIFSSTHLKKTT